MTPLRLWTLAAISVLVAGSALSAAWCAIWAMVSGSASLSAWSAGFGAAALALALARGRYLDPWTDGIRLRRQLRALDQMDDRDRARWINTRPRRYPHRNHR